MWIRIIRAHCNPVQGQYRTRTGFPGDENRFFRGTNNTQGKPCFHYRDGLAVHYLVRIMFEIDKNQFKEKVRFFYQNSNVVFFLVVCM